MTLSERIKVEAGRLGFSAAGIVPAGPALTHDFYADWLSAGMAGEMAYLHRHGPLKTDPRVVVPGTVSLIMVTHPYDGPDSGRLPSGSGNSPRSQSDQQTPLYGRISRYARGRDYHVVMREKLEALAAFISEQQGDPSGAQTFSHSVFVDSGPIMEREFAMRAGLGWVGKNANLIHWDQGSWRFLGALLVNIPLEPDAAALKGRAKAPPGGKPVGSWARESCGTCTRCIEACPTGAIVGEKKVDARLCISYLTIELKGAIPHDLRPGLGDWVFGCDICQEVCPWNHKAERQASRKKPALNMEASGPQALEAKVSAVDLLKLDEAAFKARYRDTALWRTKRRGLLRNAAVVLGNQLAGKGEGTAALSSEVKEAVIVLVRALKDHEPLVRGAAAWALGRLGGAEARDALKAAQVEETEKAVQEELKLALAEAD